MSNPPNNFNTNSNFNKFKGSYFDSDVDVCGNIICRNGNIYVGANSKIYSPMNTISFNDTTGFTNFGNSYIGGIFFVYNPTTLSNIDIVSYVNTNDSNISSINSSITTANSNISSNSSSISTINGKIGTLGYDTIYDFTTCNNLFINPGGQLQFEDSLGNHPDLIGQVITNISNIASNTTSISTINTTLTEISRASASPNNITTINNKLKSSLLAFSTSLNGVSPTAFGYISTLSTNAQTALDSKCSLSGNQTVAGIKTFSSPPIMSEASITSNTIPLAAIVGSVCDLSSTQTLSGAKTFSAAAIFSNNLRLDGSLLLNAGALTLTNANLQKLQFCSTISSDIQTQTSALQTKTQIFRTPVV